MILKHRLLKLIFGFVIVSLLASCSGDLRERHADIQKDMRSKGKDCMLYEYADRRETNGLWAASLFFDENTYTIRKGDFAILDDVAIIQKQCNKEVVLISHASDNERKDLYYELAGKRLNSVYKYLTTKGKLHKNTIARVNCANYDFLFKDKPQYSRRVDIVFLNKSETEIYYSCFNDLKQLS